MSFWNKPTSELTPEEREARAAYARQWRKDHPGKHAEYLKRHEAKYPEKTAAKRQRERVLHRERGYGERYYDKAKAEALTHYGNGKFACVLCGFDNPDALCLDHINDDGKAHRAIIGTKLHGKLRSLGYPPGLQTLCQNCNWIKETARRRAMRASLRST